MYFNYNFGSLVPWHHNDKNRVHMGIEWRTMMTAILLQHTSETRRTARSCLTAGCLDDLDAGDRDGIDMAAMPRPWMAMLMMMLYNTI